MSRVLLDHNVDPRIASLLLGHDVARASREGLSDVSNGDLIRAAHALGYDVLLTKDRNMCHQHNPHTALPVVVLEFSVGFFRRHSGQQRTFHIGET